MMERCEVFYNHEKTMCRETAVAPLIKQKCDLGCQRRHTLHNEEDEHEQIGHDLRRQGKEGI